MGCRGLPMCHQESLMLTNVSSRELGTFLKRNGAVGPGAAGGLVPACASMELLWPRAGVEP